MLIDAVREADWDRPEEARSAAMERIRAYLPAADLEFLVELSLELLAAQIEA
jgi:hypothetical protein